MDALERFYDSIGLKTPAMRFIGTGAAVLAVLYIVKPKMFFREDGEARAFSGSNPGDATATAFPVGATAAALGAISAVFI